MYPRATVIPHAQTGRPAANDDWSPDTPACAAALRPAARCAA